MEVEEIEIRNLLEAIYLKYGYDFRNYALASIKRRIQHRLVLSGLSDISAMQHRVLVDEQFFEMLLLDFSINTTSMFRDPGFYQALRDEVVPVLQGYPFLRIWVAGCSTGEEVYSLAILLLEEGLENRFQIYATDFNEAILLKAREGIFPLSRMKAYTENYIKSGGRRAFSDYYSARYDSVILDQQLKNRVVFSAHNLATDGVFNEMQLICCRNVLIYFNRVLQERVLKLFLDSLSLGGFICLGKKETMQFSGVFASFSQTNWTEKIYRRVS